MKHPKIEIIEIFLAQNGNCFYCGAPMSWLPGSYATSYTKDHFKPKSKGNGLHHNTVLAHEPCNNKKGHRSPTKEENRKFKRLYDKIYKRTEKIKQAKSNNFKKMKYPKKDNGKW